MKDFIVIAIVGISSFVICNLILKMLSSKYKKLEAIQNKYSNSQKKGLGNSVVIFILIILIVVLKEMFSIGSVGYGLLLGILLSISDFLFKQPVEEEDKNKKNNQNKTKYNNNYSKKSKKR